MTETLAVGATMRGAVFDLSPDSAGLVSPIVDTRFVVDGLEVPAQVGGAMDVRSVTCNPGYWHKPDANQETFDHERWMKTGSCT